MIIDPVFPVWLIVVLGAVLCGVALVGLVSRSSGGSRLAWGSRIVMVLLLVGIALRPGLPSESLPPAASGDVDVYFVVDTTSSMAAEDWGDGAPRLDGVRGDITAISEVLIGARFSLITFDAVTVHRVPLTSDASALAQAVRALEQEITGYSSGSSISEPVQDLTEILSTDAAENPSRTRIVYYLGDGEQTRDEPPGSFAALADLIGGGAVLGYGTEQGGPMKTYTGYDDGLEDDYIQDYSTGTDAISRIDEGALRTIADQMGVDYLHRDASTTAAEATAGIRVENVERPDVVSADPTEYYWLLAIPLGLLALVDLGNMLAAVARAARDGKVRS